MDQTRGSRPVLGSKEIHLWMIFTDRLSDPKFGSIYRKLLSSEEKQRCDRFVFDKDRHEYLLGRMLVRTVLSEYADVNPAAWCFAKNDYGKPYILGAFSSLQFNLTHTDGLVACAVCQESDIGVDAENIARSADLGVARHFFSPCEVEYLERSVDEQKREIFFDLWTLKESYIKARGLGLSLPLREFAIHLCPGRAPTISFSGNADAHPDEFQFFQTRPSLRHRLAVCVRRPDASPRRLVTRVFEI